MTKIFGIKNCDTVKKARTWLKEREIPYVFHNYKKDGIDKPAFHAAIKEHGWETVINKRGRTWHQLPDDVKNNMNEESAITNAFQNPSLIKRPILIHNEKIHIGFKPEEYEAIFK